MRTALLVQARMGSTRLPGKVLMPIMGKPLLHYLVERLRRVTKADSLAILTTHQPADDQIVRFCQKEGVDCYRGSEEDVLARYYGAAQELKIDAIVRITSDCPLIDPGLVDHVIDLYRNHASEWDYVSTCCGKRSFPRGLDVEIFSYAALEQAFQKAQKPEEREHVTLYMYQSAGLFRVHNIESEKDLSRYRLTVDTPEDFELIRRIYEALYPVNPNFDLQDVMGLLNKHPDWVLLNAHVQQKS